MRNNPGVGFVLMGLLAVAAPPALGCGFHGSLGDSFSALHPRSLDVAIALREAADAGVLNNDILAPKTVNLFGYHRAVQRLMKLETALSQTSQARDSAVPAFALLLVESSLWTRFVPTEGRVRAFVHSDGPQADDVAVVTGEAAIAAIEDGVLTIDDAFKRGLVVVASTTDDAEHIRRLLEAAARQFEKLKSASTPAG